ncbi:MAG: hypothetical protein HRU20_31560 [Pseudomonadales bacterium]|nr:hypothetical protein [Pseudomonadales bacterium]
MASLIHQISSYSSIISATSASGFTLSFSGIDDDRSPDRNTPSTDLPFTVTAELNF